MQQFLVSKANFSQAKLEPLASRALAAGEVRLKIDLFSFTANNITYASFGDVMGYWKFYPHAADASQGVIPVWGFARVTESLAEGLAVGERFYGYYPPASEVVLAASRISERGFTSAQGERKDLAAVYNNYSNCAADPFHAFGSEALQAVLRPLFMTSWLIDDFFADNSFFGSSALLLSSASSKTAYGTAFCMAQRPRDQRPEIIGLTSSANRAFCESLGCYERVLTYDELSALPESTPCAYIDFAGNAALRSSIHTRFESLAYSCSIGGTHVTELGGSKGLPGPKPTLFFAPAQIAKRSQEWGGAVLGQRLVAAWQTFAAEVSRSDKWLAVQEIHAPAVLSAYQQLLQGKTDPRQAQVWYL
jgi:hypothetical protein